MDWHFMDWHFIEKYFMGWHFSTIQSYILKVQKYFLEKFYKENSIEKRNFIKLYK